MNDTATPSLTSRPQQVYARLKEQLVTGRYAPGTRLPTLQELCAEFGVSVNTVRKAVGRLVEEGCLVSRPGAGIRVTPATPAAASATGVIAVMCQPDAAELQGLQSYGLERDVLLCPIPANSPQYDPAFERRFLEHALAHRHRGLLANCTPGGPGPAQHLQALTDAGTRVVHFNYHSLELPAQSCILPDYRRAGEMAAVHLMMAGYARLLVVTHDDAWPGGRLFCGGAMEAIRGYRGGFNEATQFFTSRSGGMHFATKVRARFRELLQAGERSVGVVAMTPHQGRRALDLAVESGWHRPEEFGVVATTYPDLSGPADVDVAGFDHAGILREGLDAILATPWSSPRRLEAPTLTCAGTVRPHCCR